jgi:hypothetical protein
LALLEGRALRNLGWGLAVLPDAVLGLTGLLGAGGGGLMAALARTVLTGAAGGSMGLILGVLTGITF